MFSEGGGELPDRLSELREEFCTCGAGAERDREHHINCRIIALGTADPHWWERIADAWPAATKLAAQQPEPPAAGEPMTREQSARDRLWCQALCETLDPSEINRVTSRFQELRTDGGAPAAGELLGEVERAVGEALGGALSAAELVDAGESGGAVRFAKQDVKELLAQLVPAIVHRLRPLLASAPAEVAGWEEVERAVRSYLGDRSSQNSMLRRLRPLWPPARLEAVRELLDNLEAPDHEADPGIEPTWPVFAEMLRDALGLLAKEEESNG